MSRTSLGAYALLLVVAIATAWWSWRHGRGEEGHEQTVTAWAMRGAVVQVHYAAKDRDVVIERKEQAKENGPALWATYTRIRPKPTSVDRSSGGGDAGASQADARGAPNAGDASAADSSQAKRKSPEASEPQRDTQRFALDERARTLLEKLAHLEAKRSLGTVSADVATELGLDDPEATIEFATDAGEHRKIEVGQTAYGANVRYVRDTTNGVVFAVDGRWIDDLRWADSRLMRRALVPFEKDDVTQIEVKHPSKGAAMWRRAETDGGKTWVRIEHASEEPDSAAEPFVAKFFRLRIQKYVTADAFRQQVGADAKPVLTLVVHPKEGAAVTVELFATGDDKDGRAFARTSELDVPVRVSRYLVRELVQDAAELLGGETK